MPTWTEVLGNRAKRGEKPLGVSRGLEPLHASLPLAGWGSVVQPISE
jgi:hypothetical protein